MRLQTCRVDSLIFLVQSSDRSWKFLFNTLPESPVLRWPSQPARSKSSQRGAILHPGNIWQRLEIIVVVTIGGGVFYWHLVDRSQGCYQTFSSEQDSPPFPTVQPQMSAVPRVRNPGLKPRLWSQRGLGLNLGFATHWLVHLGQLVWTLWASSSPSVKWGQ